MITPVNWRDDAACHNADPELFFPTGTTGPALRQILEAKRLCRTCPVRIPCLAWALDHSVTDGIWGGTTDDERRAIRHKTRKMRITREDDDGKSYHRAEHGEHGIRVQPAQAKSTRILRGAGIGRGPAGSGAEFTRGGGRHQRFAGLMAANPAPPRAAGNAARAIASRTSGGFAGDFVAADGERVVIAVLGQRQFTDLAKTTRLAGMFAFLERLLHADFSDCGDLYTHRDTIAALLAAWFARRTVPDSGSRVRRNLSAVGVPRSPGSDQRQHGIAHRAGRVPRPRSADCCEPGGAPSSR